MQQLLVFERSSEKFNDYINNINDLLKSGEWRIVSQKCAGFDRRGALGGDVIFSILLESSKPERQSETAGNN